MLDHLAAIRRESARFLAALDGVDLSAPVPSCPEWSAADLVWHLTEVQEFWASIVADLLQDPADASASERPPDTELVAACAGRSRRLLDALSARRPEDACWSWHEGGNSVRWVLRRQAHEALIHRLDAELTVGEVTAIDQELAADGIDEVLRVMLDAVDLPAWSDFTPDGHIVALEAPGHGRWTVELGRFTGTSPVSGRTYDEVALRLVDGRPASTTIRGEPAALDAWLWGRGGADALGIDGSAESVDLVREAAAAGTQ